MKAISETDMIAVRSVIARVWVDVALVLIILNNQSNPALMNKNNNSGYSRTVKMYAVAINRVCLDVCW